MLTKRKQEQAQSVAISAIGYLADDPALLSRFVALSGCDPGSFRQSAHEPGFQAGILDFFLAHEPSLMAFSANSGIAPEQIVKAKEVLSNSPSSDSL